MSRNQLTNSTSPSQLRHFNWVVCVVKTVEDLWVQVLFSFVLSYYLLMLLTGSPFGFFLVVIVGCTFLDDRSQRRRRVHTLLGQISPHLDTPHPGRIVNPSCLIHFSTFSLFSTLFVVIRQLFTFAPLLRLESCLTLTFRSYRLSTPCTELG